MESAGATRQEPDTVLGSRYEVVELIGEGGAAVVYRVRDRWNGSVRAAKVLRPESVASAQTLARFEDEFRILRGLHHVSLPEVYDYGWNGEESRYMVMELVDGEPLDAYFRKHTEDLWMILYQLCEVLSFIHRHNLLHQDIKPDNILVKRTTAFGDEMPLVKLMDFGLTYRRDADMRVSLVGTPAYMAPEIIRGDAPLTRAVDYYSLGATLYELLAGRPPFSGTGRELLAAHLNEQPWFEEERLEYTELYPHALALMSKNTRKRLEAFDRFWRETAAHVEGTVEPLERAIGVSHVASLGLIGRGDEWQALLEWGSELTSTDAGHRQESHNVRLLGAPSVGKRYLIEMLLSELAISGVKIYRIGPNTPRLGLRIEMLDDEGRRSSPERSLADTYARRWQKIVANLSPSVVVVECVDSLSDRDMEFLRYVESRIDLSFLSGEGVRTHIVLSSVKDVLISGSMTIPVSHPSQVDIANLHGNLGRFIHKDDEGRLRQFINDHRDTTARLIAALRSRIQSGGIRYEGGEWHIEQDLPPYEEVGESSSAGILLRPGSARRVLEWISCQRNGVKMSQLRELLKSEGREDDAVAQVNELRELRLIDELDTMDGTIFTFLSESARERVYGSIALEERTGMHRRNVAILCETQNRSTHEKIALGYHCAMIGDLRGMASAHLAAADALIAINDLEAARRLMEAGLQEFRKNDGYRMVARFYLKRAVFLELQRSNFTAVRKLVTEHAHNTGRRTLLTLIYPYSQALHKQAAFEEWQAALQEAKKMVVDSCSEPRWRMQLCEVIWRRERGELTAARDLLAGVLSHLQRLDPRMRVAALTARAVIASTLEHHDDLLAVYDEAQELAEMYETPDEGATIHLIKASYFIDQGRYREAMQQVVEGMRWASRYRLYDRQYNLRTKASAVFYEIGDYDRALRHMKRAHRLAVSLGDRTRVMETVARFSMNYQKLGSFSNALRYAEMAEKLSAENTNANSRVKTILYRWDLMTYLGSDEVAGQAQKALHAMHGIEHGPTVGYYHFVRASYEAMLSHEREAYELFILAKEVYEGVRFLDDATRAAIGAARCATILGERGRVAAALDYADQMIARMESQNIAAEIALAKLHATARLNMFRDTYPQLMGDLAAMRSEIFDLTLRVEINRSIIQVTRSLPVNSAPSDAFDQFSQDIRKLVSSFEKTEDAERFLSWQGFDGILHGNN